MATDGLLKEEVSVPEAIVRVLEEAGIDMVFGMPGGNTLLLFDALYDHRSTIRTILVRHESLAGVMAEVYGRLTGKPGIAIGQGAFMLSNAVLGMLEAHLGSSPMLLLADLSDNAPFSHHAPYQAGTGEYRTWDAKQSFGGFTKITMVAQEAVQAVQNTQLAIKHATTGERGPVAVLYHSASLKGLVGPDSLPHLYPTQLYLSSSKPLPADEATVEVAAQALLKARQPVIIAGNGVRISQGYRELQNLAEFIGAPVATTASGKGVFPEIHELAIGVFGNFGLPLANALVSEADVVLVVGSKLSSTDTISENPRLLDPQRQRMIQIDVEPKNTSWTFPCDHVIIGDAYRVLSQLTRALRDRGGLSQEMLNSRREKIAEGRRKYGFFNPPGFDSDEVPILPQRIIAEIHKAISENAFIACDAGENRLFMTHYFQTKSAGTFIQPAAIGGMGYAIPAALAAKLMDPTRQVVAVCGDGGFTIAMNGLITAYEEGVAIVTVVFNNRALGWVKHGQKDRVIASEFANIDYAAIARAMGCQGIRVEEPGQLAKALAEALGSHEPTVLDVVTSLRSSYEDVMSPLAIPLWESLEEDK
jgi:acetolactate synthase-1/2/3 large subunit